MTPLRQRVLEELQIRNYSPNTVRAYIRSIAEFAKHFGVSVVLNLREESVAFVLHTGRLQPPISLHQHAAPPSRRRTHPVAQV